MEVAQFVVWRVATAIEHHAKTCAATIEEMNPPMLAKPVAVATTLRSMFSRTMSKP